MSGMGRRGLLATAPALLAALRASEAAAQAWPVRPVAMVVGFAPGGSTDVVARLLAERLGAEFEQPFVVDNRAGASGTVGQAFVARARPDGHTLLVTPNSTFTMARHFFPNRGYDDERDLAPVCMIASMPIFLCVSPRSGMKDLSELVRRAKAEPGRLNYAVSGAGTAFFSTELLLGAAGIEVQRVTYRGGAQAMQALIANEVQMAFVDGVTAIPLMAAGQLVALGVSTASRSALAPDIPTIAEQGYPGFDVATDIALFAPAGTPADIIQRLHAATAKAMATPEMQERLRQASVAADVTTPEELRAYTSREGARWAEVIRSRSIKLE